MTHKQFQEAVKSGGWTLQHLRCDNAPPTDAMYELIDECGGLSDYERHVIRMQNEVDSWLRRGRDAAVFLSNG